MPQVDTGNAPSPRTIIIASVIAFVVAMLVLFTAILPAEFGKDPLGTGGLLGLTALSRGENPVEDQPVAHKSDVVEFVLDPFQSVEYKYLMDLDTSMVFSWVASNEVYYDMHAEPAGLGPEAAVSYESGTAEQQMGAFHAPFTGIHGWFWENRGSRTVEIRLYSSGFYVDATVFQDGGSYEREIASITD